MNLMGDEMELPESSRLEALRLFLTTEGRVPIDAEDWSKVADMAAYLRDGAIPEFEATDLASDGTISGGITVIEQH